LAKELAQTVGGKKIAFLIAILAAFAVLASLGNRLKSNDAEALVASATLDCNAVFQNGIAIPCPPIVTGGDVVNFMGTASNNAAGGSLVVTVNLDANYTVTDSACAAGGVGPNVLANAVTCTFPAGSTAAQARTFVEGTVIAQPNGTPPIPLTSFTSASDSDGVFPPANVLQTLQTPALIL
jgi:hypothetical protein